MEPVRVNVAGYFFESARRYPQRSAVDGSPDGVTYSELAQLATSIRHAVASTQSARVAICCERGPHSYAAILGVLAAGRSFVPLNAKFPAKRNLAILEATGATTLVASAGWSESLKRLLRESADRRFDVIIFDEALLLELEGLRNRITVVTAPAAAGPIGPPVVRREIDEAYVVFTSGSTGVPKGVSVSHGNFGCYLRNFLLAYGLPDGVRHSQMFELTFDLSIHNQFVTWACSGTLVDFSDADLKDPLRCARERNIDVWFSVPSLVAYLVSTRQLLAGCLHDVRFAFFCGERLTGAVLQAWWAVAPRSEVVNLYGPTETTVILAHFKVPKDHDFVDPGACVPLGKTFPDHQFEIRDEATGQPLPGNKPGVLWLCGPQVTSGYVNEPALTAAGFQPRDGQTWYRTGDIVYKDGTDTLHYVGREDGQVKIMGYRVELGEIEHHLRRAAAAAEAVSGIVTVQSVPELFGVLPASCEPDRHRIKLDLAAHLPAYMVPRRLFFMSPLPTGINGKVDRRKVFEYVECRLGEVPGQST